jgi:hypothetical protein
MNDSGHLEHVARCRIFTRGGGCRIRLQLSSVGHSRGSSAATYRQINIEIVICHLDEFGASGTLEVAANGQQRRRRSGGLAGGKGGQRLGEQAAYQKKNFIVFQTSSHFCVSGSCGDRTCSVPSKKPFDLAIRMASPAMVSRVGRAARGATYAGSARRCPVARRCDTCRPAPAPSLPTARCPSGRRPGSDAHFRTT